MYHLRRCCFADVRDFLVLRCSSVRGFAVAFGVLLLLLSGPSHAGSQSFVLDGAWEMAQGGEAAEYPPPSTGWSAFDVPGCIHGAGEGGVWLRRSVEVPSVEAGQRVVVRFWGIYDKPAVWVGGQQVLSGLDWVELPLNLDVTDAVGAGGSTVELLVWVKDWSASHHTKVSLAGLGVGEDPRLRAADKVISPLAPDFLCFGLLDSVELRVVPAVRVEEVRVDGTVLQGGTGTARVLPLLFNSGSEPVQVRVDGQVTDHEGKAVASFGQDGVWVYPGAQRVLLPVNSGFTRPWMPEDPYVYGVHVELKQGSLVVDSVDSAFGFRQVSKSKYVLLNGTPLVGAMEELWPQQRYYRAGAALEVLTLMKERGVGVVALQGSRWPQQWYSAALELGVPLLASGNLDCDPFGVYRYGIGDFFESAKRDLGNVLRLAARHSAVVGFAVERRMIACSGVNPATATKRGELVEELMGAARAAEDARLLFTPGDLAGVGSPDGAWVVLGMSVAQRPFVKAWLTLLSEGLALDGLETLWKWGQNVPLIVSGLTIPDRDVDASAALLGPQARFSQGRNLEKASHFFAQVRQVLWLKGASLVGAARGRYAADSTLLLPELMPPLKRAERFEWVFRSEGRHFFEGEARQLRWDVYPTGARRIVGGKVAVRGPGGEVLAERAVNLLPGEVVTIDVVVTAPALLPGQDAVDFVLNLDAEFQGESTLVKETFRVFREQVLPKLSADVGIIDPKGLVAGELLPDGGGEVLGGATDLLTAGPLVVVGPEAFDTFAGGGEGRKVYQDLEQLMLFYVESGGTLLVLPQTRYAGVLPFGLVEGDPAVTRSGGSHAIMDGVLQADLDGWNRGGKPLADGVIRPPAWGSFRCLLWGPVGGAADGCLLAEVRRGRGVLVMVQADLQGLLSTEPVAGRLLGALVEYVNGLATEQRRALRTAALDDDLGEVLELLDLDPLPASRAKECGEVVFERVEGPVADTFMSSFGSGYSKLRQLWVVTDSQEETSALTMWGSSSPEPLAAYALPLLPLGESAEGRASLLYGTLVGGDFGAGATMGAAVPAEEVEAFGPGDLEGGTAGCLMPGEVAALRLQGWEGVDLRVDVSVDVVRPGGGDLVLSLSGEQTQAVLLGQGEGGKATFMLPGGVSEGGDLLFRNETFVLDAVSGVVSRVCIREINVGRVVLPTEAQLGTLPTVLSESAFWGYPAVLDGSGRWEEAKKGLDGLALISGLLDGVGLVVDTPVGTTVEASQWDVVDSQLNGVESDGLMWLRDNGELSLEFDFPVAGPYRVVVTGRGRPANGAYPMPDVRLDGKSVGGMKFTGQLTSYFVDFNATKGAHRVSVAFVDDAYLPPEDRDAGFGEISLFALRANHPPTASIAMVSTAEGMELSAQCAYDRENDPLTYDWSWSAAGCGVDEGEGLGGGSSVVAAVPGKGTYWVTLTVTDVRGAWTRVCEEFEYDPAVVVNPEAQPEFEEVLEQDTAEADSGSVPWDVSWDGTGSANVVEEAPAKKGGGGGCSSQGASGDGVWSAMLLLLSLLSLLAVSRRALRC